MCPSFVFQVHGGSVHFRIQEIDYSNRGRGEKLEEGPLESTFFSLSLSSSSSSSSESEEKF